MGFDPSSGNQLDVTESTVDYPPGGQPVLVTQWQGLDVSPSGQVAPRPVNPTVAQTFPPQTKQRPKYPQIFLQILSLKPSRNQLNYPRKRRRIIRKIARVRRNPRRKLKKNQQRKLRKSDGRI